MEVLAAAVVVIALVATALWACVARPLMLAHHYRSQGLGVLPFIPVVGNMGEVISKNNSLVESYFKTFRGWEERYGAPCVFFNGPEVRVLISDPDLVREILGKHSYAFFKSSLLHRVLGPVLGAHSLLLSEGDEHKRHRRIASSAFHFSALSSSVPLMGACAVEGAERWAARIDDAVASPEGGWVELDVHNLLTPITLDIIGRSGVLWVALCAPHKGTVAGLFSSSSICDGRCTGWRRVDGVYRSIKQH